MDKKRFFADTGCLMLRGLAWIPSLLPLGVLYAGADLLAWLLGGVARYRRRVVRENLASSFPGTPRSALRRMERGFYRFLADYFVETLKLLTMSRREMERRMRFEGMDLINEAVSSGSNVSIYLGHYGNWEWISSMPLHISPRAASIQLYHPLENSAADRFFLHLRGRFGAESVSMQESLRRITGYCRAGRPTVTGYIADQVPGWHSIHLWLPFLNHDTPVFSGPERISRMIKARVLYADVTRPRRGYYVCRFSEISPDASMEPKFSVTREYFRLLEQTIRRQPPLWLWSHRRWKRTHERFNEIFPDRSADERLARL